MQVNRVEREDVVVILVWDKCDPEDDSVVGMEQGQSTAVCAAAAGGGGARDSRAVQCAAFNDQEFMGRLYNWEPFTEAVSPVQRVRSATTQRHTTALLNEE
uniref:Uncharacterized protein n=1 Tax=Knipowitschia caucasica TaxID=637954 RepID=A0AAV2MCI1_KNICA